MVDAAREEKRRRLELTRADFERQLAAATAEPRREALRQALEALASELAALGEAEG